MSLFYICNNGTDDSAVSYTGIDSFVAEALLAERGLSFIPVSEKEYTVFVESKKVPLPTPTDLSADRATLKNPLATTDQKVNSLIKVLGF